MKPALPSLFVVFSLVAPTAAYSQEVAVIAALNDPAWGQRVQESLACTGEFQGVDFIDLTETTPTAVELLNYHAILYFADTSPLDRQTLGDSLALFHHNNNGIVYGFGSLLPQTSPQGQWLTEQVLPVSFSDLPTDSNDQEVIALDEFQWLVARPGHWLANGVNSLFSGHAFRHTDLTLPTTQELILTYEDGVGAVWTDRAVPDVGVQVVVNLWPPDHNTDPTSWRGDGARLFANALMEAMRDVRPANGCINDYVVGDLDCNLTQSADEPIIDLTQDEVCETIVDPLSLLPYTNADTYYQDEVFGCDYFVGDKDLDGDGLVGESPYGMIGQGVLLSKIVHGNPLSNNVIEIRTIDQEVVIAPEDCQLNFYVDGSSDVLATINLSTWDLDGDGNNDPLIIGEPYVICHPDQQLTAECDMTAALLQHDGNDVIELVCNEQVQDIFGQITASPSNWSEVIPVTNATVHRFCDTAIGDTNGTDPFDAAAEGWLSFPENDAQFIGLDVCKAIFPVYNPDGNLAQTVYPDCDNCPNDFNPLQQDIDCDGVGDVCDNCLYTPNPTGFGEPQENSDDDCFGDACDNCPSITNTDQADFDQDGVGDACDNCLAVFNPSQTESDVGSDGQPQPDFWGDGCDNCPTIYNPGQGDADHDGIGDICDACPIVFNPDQNDADGDGIGDLCDRCPQSPGTLQEPDYDSDGRGDSCDNCPTDDNTDQTDTDYDGIGDACDNCPAYFNELQTDQDQDGYGDACDLCPQVPDSQIDTDQDGVGDACDGCPLIADSNSANTDGDGFSDECDLCVFVASLENNDDDGDGIGNACDNCPLIYNPNQEDRDNDGNGDACIEFLLRGGGRLSSGCSTSPFSGGTGILTLFMIIFSTTTRKRRCL